jgi:desampylase
MAIPAAVLRGISAHARDAWPAECCGLLVGTANAIELAWRARNLHPESRTHYLVDPADHFAAIRSARAIGLEVVGAYHSHPAGRPRPSATDCAEAQAGAFVHVIAGSRRLRRARRHRSARCPGGRAARPCAGSRHCSCQEPRGHEAQGYWVTAWRIAQGNFTAIPLVRLP